MSSTSGKVNQDEYYITPKWLVHEFFDAFESTIDKDWWMYARVLDPSCGGDEKNDATYPAVLADRYGNDIDIMTMDIREDSHAAIKCNYLERELKAPYTMIVTNPPFSISTEFAEKAIEEVEDGGYVIMLQRLNWLGSKKRKPFWDKMPLRAIFVHHKRAGFNPEKPSAKDSIEYAHFVFKKGYKGNAETFIV